MVEDRNAKSNINERPRRRKAGEKMSELVRQKMSDMKNKIVTNKTV